MTPCPFEQLPIASSSRPTPTRTLTALPVTVVAADCKMMLSASSTCVPAARCGYTTFWLAAFPVQNAYSTSHGADCVSASVAIFCASLMPIGAHANSVYTVNGVAPRNTRLVLLVLLEAAGGGPVPVTAMHAS